MVVLASTAGPLVGDGGQRGVQQLLVAGVEIGVDVVEDDQVGRPDTGQRQREPAAVEPGQVLDQRRAGEGDPDQVLCLAQRPVGRRTVHRVGEAALDQGLLHGELGLEIDQGRDSGHGRTPADRGRLLDQVVPTEPATTGDTAHPPAGGQQQR